MFIKEGNNITVIIIYITKYVHYIYNIYIYILNHPEIDKIWIFHDISNNNLKNGTLFDVL